jgi:transcriptional regulator with XRE-family HTH domain
MKILTQDEVLRRLREKQGERSMRKFAILLGISVSYLSEIYKKTRNPNPAVLKALGIGKERTITTTYFETNGRSQSLSARAK